MVLTVSLFFIGFYILIKGANFLVEGASSLAHRFKISLFVIGLVIAGIGTSIPEFAVSFIANLSGEGDIGIGTIVGSNSFNILFILGLSAFFVPLVMKAEWVERDLVWNMLSVLLAASFTIPFGDGIVTRFEGGFMLALFLGWLYAAVKKSNSVEGGEEPLRILTFPIAAGLILSGLLGVVVGGRWVVDGALVLAQYFSLSDAFIGLTIVGIGTSLPELAVTFAAALKRQPGIAVGNIIGSNIFDFLMILGVSALVKPFTVSPNLFFDMTFTLFAATLLYGSMYVGTPYILKRWQGFIFLVIYGLYILYRLSIQGV